MDFLAGTRACESCSDRSQLSWSNVHSGDVWVTSATCPRCGSARRYVFVTNEDLIEVEPPELELGDGPSTVLDAATLQAELARLGPFHAQTFDWDVIERAQTAVNELGKLVAAGLAPGVDGAAVEQQRAQLAALVTARTALPPIARIDDPDPAVRARALELVLRSPQGEARARVLDAFESNVNLWMGMEDLVWRVIGSYLAEDTVEGERARKRARRSAQIGRGTRALFDALCKYDSEWMVENAERVARSNPALTNDLVDSFSELPTTAARESLRARVGKAIASR
jgi:hypothetical protein